jgi:hypothetical protein
MRISFGHKLIGFHFCGGQVFRKSLCVAFCPAGAIVVFSPVPRIRGTDDTAADFTSGISCTTAINRECPGVTIEMPNSR